MFKHFRMKIYSQQAENISQTNKLLLYVNGKPLICNHFDILYSFTLKHHCKVNYYVASNKMHLISKTNLVSAGG